MRLPIKHQRNLKNKPWTLILTKSQMLKKCKSSVKEITLYEIHKDPDTSIHFTRMNQYKHKINSLQETMLNLKTSKVTFFSLTHQEG